MERQRGTLITETNIFGRKIALELKTKECGLDSVIMFFVESSGQIRLEPLDN